MDLVYSYSRYQKVLVNFTYQLREMTKYTCNNITKYI